jgi:diguanylate cyclase (GGDEF)-like protein/PAS domain S-box-containing protein
VWSVLTSNPGPLQQFDTTTGDGTPFPHMMVPNAYGAVWCDAETGTYWCDGCASAVLGIGERGPLSEPVLTDILAELAPGPHKDAPQYSTFRNHRGSICRARLVPAPDGRQIVLVDDLTDITSRIFQLKASEREYNDLFENSSFGIYLVSFDRKCVRANPGLLRLLGFASERELQEWMSHSGSNFYVDPDRYGQFYDELDRTGKVTDFISELQNPKTGERFWISETGWVVRDAAGQPRYYAGTIANVTAHMQYLHSLRTAAETDALTGLANRAAFNAELGRRIAGGADAPIAVLLIDLDRFKDVNDIFGHARGDQVLKICASRLASLLPPGAFLARLGGDEFAIVASGAAQSDAIMAVADSVASRFEAPIEIEGASHLLGASVGIACYPEHGSNAIELMRNADIALYGVKEEGRGHARIFDQELDHRRKSRLALEIELRGACERGELELHYQPVVDAASMRTEALEALLRWRHPTRGLVAPNEFIPVAEDAGLMLGFGDWVIREVCRHAAALPDHIRVAINVSALQFRSSDLPGIVAAALAENKIRASRLVLEVTESVVLRNENATYAVLEQLRALGVRLALDDFGTGYSSLSYLQHYRFDKVKIDRSFVRSITTDPVNRAITRAVISIARDLGMAVVAEGIETEVERQSLMKEGCRLLQGYYFGRPVPLAEAARRIAQEALLSLEEEVNGLKPALATAG